MPALVLWTVESYPLDVVANRIKGSTIAEAPQYLENLLNGTMILAIAVIGFTVITWRISLNPSRMRKDVRVWPSVAVLGRRGGLLALPGRRVLHAFPVPVTAIS